MSNYTVLFKYGKATKRTCHFFNGRFYGSIFTILWNHNIRLIILCSSNMVRRLSVRVIFLLGGFMILFLLYFGAFYETITPLDMTGL